MRTRATRKRNNGDVQKRSFTGYKSISLDSSQMRLWLWIASFTTWYTHIRVERRIDRVFRWYKSHPQPWGINIFGVENKKFQRSDCTHTTLRKHAEHERGYFKFFLGWSLVPLDWGWSLVWEGQQFSWIYCFIPYPKNYTRHNDKHVYTQTGHVRILIRLSWVDRQNVEIHIELEAHKHRLSGIVKNLYSTCGRAEQRWLLWRALFDKETFV